MTNREASNRIVKALAIAHVLDAAGVSFAVAHSVKLDQGPFWSEAVKATGRKNGELSEETRFSACYFLAALEYAKTKRKQLQRVK
jgi:hypothetical protein